MDFNIKKQIAILNRVKKLTTIPKTQFTHVKEVADFFQVSTSTINRIINNNMEEFRMDGLVRLKKDKLKQFKLENEIPSNLIKTGSLTIIPCRTVFRIGMLLQKSEVARRLRTYLLDVEEMFLGNDGEVVVLSKEETLLMNIMRGKTEDEINEATTIYKEYVNRSVEISKENLFKF